MDVLLSGISFGEQPRWHDGRLWFSDWGPGDVIAVDLNGRSKVAVHVGSFPCCADWLPDGRLVVVSTRQGAVLRREPDGSLVVHGDLASASSPPAGNELVVDGRGNAYVNGGGFNLAAGEAYAPGVITLVTADGAARVVADGLAFPNGMLVTADNETLLVAESYAKRLTAFDVDADGGLSNRRVWADLGDGVPDGICLEPVSCSRPRRPLPASAIRDGLVQEPVEAARQADAARERTDREQRARHVRLGARAGVLPQRKPLAFAREHDLGRDREAREAERVHLGRADRRASRLARAVRLLDRDSQVGRANLVEPLGELARGAARRVRLAGARIVDHFPRREVTRGLGREAQQKRRRDREVAGGDHADASFARERVDLLVVRRREPARSDDDPDAAFERGEHVRLHRG